MATRSEPTGSEIEFMRERHLGTLTTLRADGSPHVVAIAFAYDERTGKVSIISSDATQKIANVERDPRVAICQVDGPRWLTLEGQATVLRSREAIDEAVAAFERRYRPVRENPSRVAIEVEIERVLGRG